MSIKHPGSAVEGVEGKAECTAPQDQTPGVPAR